MELSYRQTLPSRVTLEAEKRKAKIKEDYRKKRAKAVNEIRHRRYLITQGEEETKGVNNRKRVRELINYISEQDIQVGRKVDAIDAAKHRIQAKQSKKHKWSF